MSSHLGGSGRKRNNGVPLLSELHELESFVPEFVMTRIAHGGGPGGARRLGMDDQNGHSTAESPYSERYTCAVSLMDISGFTQLAHRLQGAHSATGFGGSGEEELSAVLNIFFSRMIDLIYEHGGDVVKFAGDALLVVFQVKRSPLLAARRAQAAAEARAALRLATSRHSWVEMSSEQRREAIGLDAQREHVLTAVRRVRSITPDSPAALLAVPTHDGSGGDGSHGRANGGMPSSSRSPEAWRAKLLQFKAKEASDRDLMSGEVASEVDDSDNDSERADEHDHEPNRTMRSNTGERRRTTPHARFEPKLLYPGFGSDIDTCMRCDMTLVTALPEAPNDLATESAAVPRRCALCGVLCCGYCCDNDVWEMGCAQVLQVCDHCFSLSNVIGFSSDDRSVEAAMQAQNESPHRDADAGSRPRSASGNRVIPSTYGGIEAKMKSLDSSNACLRCNWPLEPLGGTGQGDHSVSGTDIACERNRENEDVREREDSVAASLHSLASSVSSALEPLGVQLESLFGRLKAAETKLGMSVETDQSHGAVASAIQQLGAHLASLSHRLDAVSANRGQLMEIAGGPATQTMSKQEKKSKAMRMLGVREVDEVGGIVAKHESGHVNELRSIDGADFGNAQDVPKALRVLGIVPHKSQLQSGSGKRTKPKTQKPRPRRNCAMCGELVCEKCCRNEVWDSQTRRRIMVCAHCYSSPDKIEFDSDGLRSVTLRCVQCCLEVQKTLDNFGIGGLLGGDEGLRLHIGVGAGELQLLSVGGVLDRWEFLVAGEALLQMAHAEHEAHAGEVCLSRQAWGMVAGRCDYDEHRRARGVVCVRQVRQPIEPVMSEWRWAKWDDAQRQTSDCPPKEVRNALLRYVPAPVRAQLQQFCVRGPAAVAELRKVSVLFVNLPDIDYGAESSEVLATLQSAMQTMQEEVYKFEGCVRQFIMDDKGTTVILAFGLYPFAHENDALLACRCAIAICTRLSMLSRTCKIGITTGRVFSGVVGSKRRREFALIGEVVIRAARLMVAALQRSDVEREDILCDATTRRYAAKGVAFKALQPITLKGSTEAVEIFAPKHEHHMDDTDTMPLVTTPVQSMQTSLAASIEGGQEQSVGHKHALNSLRSCVEALSGSQNTDIAKSIHSRGSVVVLEGPCGIGKTWVVRKLLSLSTSTHRATVRNLCSAADTMHRFVPYHGLREAFERLLNSDQLDLDVAQAKLQESDLNFSTSINNSTSTTGSITSNCSSTGGLAESEEEQKAPRCTIVSSTTVDTTNRDTTRGSNTMRRALLLFDLVSEAAPQEISLLAELMPQGQQSAAVATAAKWHRARGRSSNGNGNAASIGDDNGTRAKMSSDAAWELSGAARAVALRGVLLRVLLAYCKLCTVRNSISATAATGQEHEARSEDIRRCGGVLFVVENAHNLDEQSWELLNDISSCIFDRTCPMMLVLSQRPQFEVQDSNFAATVLAPARSKLSKRATIQALSTAAGTSAPQPKLLSFITLQPFDRAETLKFLALILNVSIVPPLLADFVFDQTAGNPMYAKELTRLLFELEAISIESIAPGHGRTSVVVDPSLLFSSTQPSSSRHRTQTDTTRLAPNLSHLIGTGGYNAMALPKNAGRRQSKSVESRATSVVKMKMSNFRGVPLPDSLEGVFSAHIDRLQPSQKWLLKVISVVGSEGVIHYNLLCQVLEREASAEHNFHKELQNTSNRTQHSNPVSDLRALVRANFLRYGKPGDSTVDDVPVRAASPGVRVTSSMSFASGGMTPDGSTVSEYCFKSSMVQQAAYSMVLFTERRRLHNAVADALQAQGRNSVDTDALVSDGALYRRRGLASRYAQIAQHRLRGGNPHDAVTWYVRAANIARENCQLACVIAHLGAAVRTDTLVQRCLRVHVEGELSNSQYFCSTTPVAMAATTSIGIQADSLSSMAPRALILPLGREKGSDTLYESRSNLSMSRRGSWAPRKITGDPAEGDDTSVLKEATVRAARWMRQLGEAHASMHRIDIAMQYFDVAVSLTEARDTSSNARKKERKKHARQYFHPQKQTQAASAPVAVGNAHNTSGFAVGGNILTGARSALSQQMVRMGLELILRGADSAVANAKGGDNMTGAIEWQSSHDRGKTHDVVTAVDEEQPTAPAPEVLLEEEAASTLLSVAKLHSMARRLDLSLEVATQAVRLLQGASIAHRSQTTQNLAEGYALLCHCAARVLVIPALAQRLGAVAQRLAEASCHPPSIAYVSMVICEVSLLDGARWAMVRDNGHLSVEIYRSLRDAPSMERVLVTLADSALFEGDANRARMLLAEAFQSAAARGSDTMQLRCLLGRCAIHRLCDDAAWLKDATAADDIGAACDAGLDDATHFWLSCVRLQLRIRGRKWHVPDATKVWRDALEQALVRRHYHHGSLAGFVTLTEAFIALLESDNLSRAYHNMLQGAGELGETTHSIGSAGNGSMAWPRVSDLQRLFRNAPHGCSALHPQQSEPILKQIGLARADVERWLVALLKGFRTLKDALPVAAPVYKRMRGAYYWEIGKRDKALSKWNEAMKLAVQFGTKVEEGLLHNEIGRHCDHRASGDLRSRHLEAANNFFSDAGLTLVAASVASELGMR